MSIMWAGDCWTSLPSQTGHGAAISQPDLQVSSSYGVGHRKLPQWVQGEFVADLGWCWTCSPQVYLKGVMSSAKARGFELSYLGKLSTVKDTHTRQPLLHHVCVLLMQLYPHSSDLHSDITAVTKASKVSTCSFTCVGFFWCCLFSEKRFLRQKLIPDLFFPCLLSKRLWVSIILYGVQCGPKAEAGGYWNGGLGQYPRERDPNEGQAGTGKGQVTGRQTPEGQRMKIKIKDKAGWVTGALTVEAGRGLKQAGQNISEIHAGSG